MENWPELTCLTEFMARINEHLWPHPPEIPLLGSLDAGGLLLLDGSVLAKEKADPGLATAQLFS